MRPWTFAIGLLLAAPAAESTSLRRTHNMPFLPDFGPFAVVTDLDQAKLCLFKNNELQNAKMPSGCLCDFSVLKEKELKCAEPEQSRETKKKCETIPCEICCTMNFEHSATIGKLNCKKKCPGTETVEEISDSMPKKFAESLKEYATMMVPKKESQEVKTSDSLVPVIETLPSANKMPATVKAPKIPLEEKALESDEDRAESAKKKFESESGNSADLKIPVEVPEQRFVNTTAISQHNAEIIESEAEQHPPITAKQKIASPFEETE